MTLSDLLGMGGYAGGGYAHPMRGYGGYGGGYGGYGGGMMPSNVPQQGVIMGMQDTGGYAGGAPATSYSPQQISANIAQFLAGRSMPTGVQPDTSGTAAPAPDQASDPNAAAAAAQAAAMQRARGGYGMGRGGYGMPMYGGYGRPMSLGSMMYGGYR